MPFGVDVLGFLLWYFAFLLSVTLHEAAHAWAAYAGGDPTAYRAGQVTLDPLPHIRREPVGTVLVPVLSYFLNGWMMGWASAPYDPLWAGRHPRRAGLMAAAGPAANLALAAVVLVLGKVLLLAGVLAIPERVRFSQVLAPAAAGAPPWLFGACRLLSIVLMLNVLLACFNLLPLPPLDGAAILPAFLPDALGRPIRLLYQNPMLSLLGLFVAWSVFGRVIAPVFVLVLHLLYAGVH
jgi:Zn-dependent protease